MAAAATTTATTAAAEPRSLLVSECMFATASLCGLDEPVEVCAVDRSDLPPGGPPRWPGRWAECCPAAPASTEVPEEGGFLLRPLRGVVASWTSDASSRRLVVPPRSVHDDGEPACTVLTLTYASPSPANPQCSTAVRPRPLCTLRARRPPCTCHCHPTPRLEQVTCPSSSRTRCSSSCAVRPHRARTPD